MEMMTRIDEVNRCQYGNENYECFKVGDIVKPNRSLPVYNGGHKRGVDIGKIVAIAHYTGNSTGKSYYRLYVAAVNSDGKRIGNTELFTPEEISHITLGCDYGCSGAENKIVKRIDLGDNSGAYACRRCHLKWQDRPVNWDLLPFEEWE